MSTGSDAAQSDVLAGTVSLRGIAAAEQVHQAEARAQQLLARRQGLSEECTASEDFAAHGPRFKRPLQRVFACLACQKQLQDIKKGLAGTTDSGGGAGGGGGGGGGGGDDDAVFGFCYACSMRCHLNCSVPSDPLHSDVAAAQFGDNSNSSMTSAVIELFEKRDFRCDCGTPRSRGGLDVASAGAMAIVPRCCFVSDATYDDERGEDNIGNQYGHNFVSRYCICDGAYLPHETMFQCVACQDWFHDRCLAPPSVTEAHFPKEAAADLVCARCTQALNPVLGCYPHLRYRLECPDGLLAGSAENVIHAFEFKQFWFAGESQQRVARTGAVTDADLVPYIEYDVVQDGGKTVFVLSHTFTPPAMRGRGIAERFARGVLRWLMAQNEACRLRDDLAAMVQVELQCSFLHTKFNEDQEFARLFLKQGSKKEQGQHPCYRSGSKSLEPHIGATWWHSGWRTQLCRCPECLPVLQQTKVANVSLLRILSEGSKTNGLIEGGLEVDDVDDGPEEDDDSALDTLLNTAFGTLEASQKREAAIAFGDGIAQMKSKFASAMSDILEEKKRKGETPIITLEDVQSMLASFSAARTDAPKRARFD